MASPSPVSLPWLGVAPEGGDAARSARPQALAASADSRYDTTCHSIEHDCVHCERNRTGLWAQRDVLRRHRTDVLTDALYRETLALIRRRCASTPGRPRHAD